MRAFRAKDMTSLHEKLTRTLVEAPAEELDMVTAVDVQIHDVIAEALTMKWDFDLKDLWLTPSRWSTMVKQYLDPDELEAWIAKCVTLLGTKNRGIGLMRTKTVAAQGGAAQGFTNKERRRWGSCMISISYKALPKPTITLHSRTSYLGYLAGMDMTVAWMCGRYLAKAMKVKVEDFSFIWMLEGAQYHNFKCLAYLLNYPDEVERARYRHLLIDPMESLTPEETKYIRSRPGLYLTKKWMDNMVDLDERGKTLGDMSYNTYRRIRRRYHTEVYGYEYAKQFEGWSYFKKSDSKGHVKGDQNKFERAYKPLPSTPVHTLDFSKIGMPLNAFGKVQYRPEDIDDYDEDEEFDE